MIPRQALFEPLVEVPAAPPSPPPPTPDTPPLHASRRADGWSAARQRNFLEAIAEGHGVDAACARVGLSAASAYAFRRTATGAAFALGWRAASLVAREVVAETLMVRALDGQTDTYTRADGTVVTRHRHDNRLAMSLLARLDRQVEAPPDVDVKAARLVAQEFDAYLDLVARDDGPARAGLFLARRSGGLDGDDTAHDLAPIYALAAADRFARTGVATAQEVPVDDLDPARRDHWNAEQWRRAEAAGLLALAAPVPEPATEPAPEPAPHFAPAPQDSQHSSALCAEDRVWWDDETTEWHTCFPPPPGFDGDEEGEPGDFGYERTLTAAEADAMGPGPDTGEAAESAQLALERDIFFGFATPSDAEPAPDPVDGPTDADPPPPLPPPPSPRVTFPGDAHALAAAGISPRQAPGNGGTVPPG